MGYSGKRKSSARLLFVSTVLFGVVFAAVRLDATERNGFNFGIGVGAGATYANATTYADGANESVLLADFPFHFRFGLALTNRIQLVAAGIHGAYWQDTWERITYVYTEFETSALEKIALYIISPLAIPFIRLFSPAHYQMGGITVYYFVSEHAPSWLFSVGWGGFLSHDPIRERWDVTGGLNASVGYEILSGNTFELQLMFSPVRSTMQRSSLFTVLFHYTIVIS